MSEAYLVVWAGAESTLQGDLTMCMSSVEVVGPSWSRLAEEAFSNPIMLVLSVYTGICIRKLLLSAQEYRLVQTLLRHVSCICFYPQLVKVSGTTY